MTEQRRKPPAVSYQGKEPIVVILETGEQYHFKPGGSQRSAASADAALFEQLQDFDVIGERSEEDRTLRGQS